MEREAGSYRLATEAPVSTNAPLEHDQKATECWPKRYHVTAFAAVIIIKFRGNVC